MTKKMKKKQIVFSVPAASGRIRNSYGSRTRWTWQWSQNAVACRKRITARHHRSDQSATWTWNLSFKVPPRTPEGRQSIVSRPEQPLLQQTPQTFVHPSTLFASTNLPQDENGKTHSIQASSWKIQSLSARELKSTRSESGNTHGEKKKHPSVRREKANKRERKGEREREREISVSFLASKEEKHFLHVWN